MARYADAIQWIISNDCTEWMHDENGCISVTAALVADLFGKNDEQVKSDLLELYEREQENS